MTIHWGYIIGALWLSCTLIFWWLADHAEDGYEDESGYHHGDPK